MQEDVKEHQKLDPLKCKRTVRINGTTHNMNRCFSNIQQETVSCQNLGVRLGDLLPAQVTRCRMRWPHLLCTVVNRPKSFERAENLMSIHTVLGNLQWCNQRQDVCDRIAKIISETSCEKNFGRTFGQVSSCVSYLDSSITQNSRSCSVLWCCDAIWTSTSHSECNQMIWERFEVFQGAMHQISP